MPFARKLVVRWDLPGTDPAQVGIHFAVPGPADQEGAVETAFDAFWQELRTFYPAQVVLGEYRWYGRADSFPFGETDWGDSFRVIDRNLAGFATANVCPLEAACCITLGMPSVARRNQGRIYLPPPGVNALVSDGRWASGFLSVVSGEWDDFDAACRAAGYWIVVRTTKGAPPPPLGLRPTQFRVDNNPDTQRRRGHKLWTSRLVTTAEPMP